MARTTVDCGAEEWLLRVQTVLGLGQCQYEQGRWQSVLRRRAECRRDQLSEL